MTWRVLQRSRADSTWGLIGSTSALERRQKPMPSQLQTKHMKCCMGSPGLRNGMRLAAVLASNTCCTLLADDSWIDDQVLNTAMCWLSQRVNMQRDLRSSVILATVQFTRAIIGMYTKVKQRPEFVPTFLKTYTAFLKAGRRTVVYFPAHIHGNHWIMLQVNFNKKTISWGGISYICFVS